jgi:hypothetical protein
VLFTLEPFGSVYVLPVRLAREGQIRKRAASPSAPAGAVPAPAPAAPAAPSPAAPAPAVQK